MVSVAFSEKYFESLLKLTPNEQSQANKSVMLFQQNPQHSSLHYEKLTAFKDSKLRSIRANQDVRIILAAVEKENLYLVLYVDHHEPAYDWAARRKVEINPNTGSLQVFTVEERVESALGTPVVQEVPGLFDAVRDRQLLQLGVPKDALPLVRNMKTEADLEAARVAERIPPDAYDGLFMLMAGASFDEAYQEVVPAALERVDPEDYTAALARPESRAVFTVADNEQALQEVFSQSIEKWRVFLHPAQRRLAEGDKNGPVRVLGGAGTGKTVVAMHRAKWLANNFAREGEKILFTTFTRNLAADIQHNLSKICSADALSRIEVINLDAWVINFLKRRGYDYGPLMDAPEERRLWEQAYSEKPADIDLSLAFFQEEWARVIQPQSVASLEGYIKASRIGRGTRLNRKQRVDIWPVFERYRYLLTSNRLKETDDIYRDARVLLENNPELRPNLYAVIVDEAQDMGTQAFKLIRALVPEGPNDLFIVGDGHQRIYGKNKVVLGQCGINIRGRSARLKVNYRTTDETRKHAVSILEGVEVDDLDGGVDNQNYYHSLLHGPAPDVCCFDSMAGQAEAILSVVKENEWAPEACCVIARTRREVEALKTALESRGRLCHLLDGRSSVTPDGALNLATMHRVKGLEFDAVFVASANKGLLPLSYVVDAAADAVTRRQRETEERALVYVSLTRARKRAFIYGYGSLSPWFAPDER
ncbi:UvrD-helicase domain-containing protein [Microbulbifer thermotolerans]|uniref:UvrD-helicase domain-containing protein n=1 Tax=Microbulbifer thermotolerans TaxID=252514 RepID=UPI0022499D41|nr:UvrD-helicase domain-containing protein [Microbulbifer thermotolerans]MCX2779241.1 AAA family ATPase [Microbulbifer thermotolerans]MCX2803665.1 AAA family ATPase [Microbulbifer thermotolerans]MCX2830428.1 AAA family ATPase [Microbulbifer thermotolerans]